MGGCAGKSIDPEFGPLIKVDRMISKYMKAKQKEAEKIHKFLLLGPGSAGKSTIFKQVNHLYGSGFSDADRLSYLPQINANVVYSMKQLITFGRGRFGGFDSEDMDAIADGVMEMTTDEELTEDVAENIATLWSCEIIQNAYISRAEMHVPECAAYFFGKIRELGRMGYVPTMEDVLRARTPTTAIVERSVIVQRIPFLFVDVGGQKNERRKWIHCFEDATAVLFVAAISEYDEVLIEDEKTNRLKDALDLFNQVCSEYYLKNCAKIIFLNKMDLFEKKLKMIPLSTCFSDYDGDNSVDDAYGFIKDKFKLISRMAAPRKEVYIHATCATDTTTMEKIFNSVWDIVLNINIAQAGMDV